MNLLMSELFFSRHESLVLFLEQNEFYSITTDGWTSKKKKKAFIALTIHYLNSKFLLENISLGLIKADYDHNADNLTEHLNQLLEQYRILNKVTLMVVDHASTMGSVCVKMDREFHGCFAHFLNLGCYLISKTG